VVCNCRCNLGYLSNAELHPWRGCRGTWRRDFDDEGPPLSTLPFRRDSEI
uniref:Uncharacterized protein n=2 Tax=Aegilops tauschii TaxID=37682 RepID=A0A453AA89_AEGTS